MNKVVYVDNNATTRVAPEVLEAMLPYFKDQYGNPSSMHSFGGNIKKDIEEAREKAAALIGAEPSEIVFTSCGTESNNASINGAISAIQGKNTIITSRVEHPAVLNTCQALAKNGKNVVEVSVNKDGELDLDELKQWLTEDVSLVTIMWANNETGVIYPIERIAQIVKEKGAVMHTDAVQAVGKIPIDLKKTPVDLLSISGHKLHAPKGVGVQYIRKGTRIRPYLIGGHQELGRRAGTENVPYIVGFGKACELAMKNMEENAARIKKLRDKLESELIQSCKDTCANSANMPRLPNTTNISFQFVEGESILLLMDEIGVCASSGSACSSGSLEPSHVLRAMGVPFTTIHGSIRFSFSHYNTEDEVDYIVEKLPPIVARLREISPFGK